MELIRVLAILPVLWLAILAGMALEATDPGRRTE